MAVDAEGEAARAPPPLPLSNDGAAGLTELWPALLVALVAALLAWLWYGRDDGKEVVDKEAAAAAAKEGPSSRWEREAAAPAAAAPESLQVNCKDTLPETKSNDLPGPQESVGNQLEPPGEHGVSSVPREFPEKETLTKEPTTPLMNYKEHLGSEAFCCPATATESLQSQGGETHGGGTPTEAGASPEKHEERCKEQPHHSSVDHEEWEMVPEHLAWGDATRKGSGEDSSSKDLEQAKRVAAVSPMPQTVHVTFRVHYITHSEAQLIAVTGDHECLGQWHHYVPLRCDKDGFWSDSVVLPADTRVEWKFIVVENGKVRRWEECDNRTLTTEHEDRVAHKWWGYH
uniref:Starch-binding domain-containing protein 1 n=1 Tax=Salvator merianae TaxID=96440 RepID=A0A8D0C338_SALMN